MSEEVEKPDTPDPEPEGAIEVDLGGSKQKVVPVGVIAAERARVREKTEQKFKGEIETLKAQAAKAQQLEADLNAFRPHLEHLQKHPELMKRDEPPAHQAISDEQAEKFARQFELYTPTGLDLGRAKAIIAANQADTERIAKKAAQEAVAPVMQGNATQQSRQNFLWAAQEAQRRGVDPKAVADLWTTLPAELTQHGEVAQLLLRASIGDAVFAGRALTPATHEPLFSEPPGGPRQQPYTITPVEQRMAQTVGMNEKDWTAAAKTYQPDTEIVLGD